MPFLIALLCWFALNAWMTHRVLRTGSGLERKGLLIGMVWITPFFGALIVIARGHVRAHERHTEVKAETGVTRAPSAVESAPPPAKLQAPGVPPLPLAPNMGMMNGFPIVHWTAVDAWLAAIADPEARLQARQQSRRAWLLHMRDVLGPHFSLLETEHAFVLSSLEDTVAMATARYVSSARKQIAHVLGRLARLAPGEKSVLLVLNDEDWYYHYVSLYYPDGGEFAFSGGMFINAGCPHFVVRRAHLSAIEPTIAHELTHSALSHLRLPLWLDEGIAVNTERRVAGPQPGQYTPLQLHDMHLRFWDAEKVQEFWSGASFQRTDDGNLLSYDLARILVNHMSKSREAFEAFVLHANAADAGAASAETYLQVDLGVYVCALTEREPQEAWSPRPQAREERRAAAAPRQPA